MITPSPKRILYVVGGKMIRGGTESFIMNYYRSMDRTKLQIDFIIHGFEKGVYDDEIKSMGGIIYNIPIKSEDIIGNIKELKKIFNSKKYLLVHSHMDAMGAVVLKIAKHCNIPIRIAHSHSTQHQISNKLSYLMNECARKKIVKYATHLFACAEDAGEWLFGKHASQAGKVSIIRNAININKFKFNPEARSYFRNKLNIEDNFVIGHVGRLSNEKNHIFLLNVVSELTKTHPHIKLILIGEGPLKEKIKDKARELKIEENVIMLGSRQDINLLLNTMDLFVLPSLFEGLTIVGIEAQANGLPIIMSSNVPKEVDITNTIKFLSLEEPIKIWVDEVLKIMSRGSERYSENYEMLTNKGYNIQKEAEKLQNIYIELLNKV